MSDRQLTEWELSYNNWDPQQQPLREALTTLGNGHFAVRGAAEESRAGGPHYPGTYLTGGFNRLESEVSGKIIENEDLVNWPNWLRLAFRVEQDDWFDLGKVEIFDYEQKLDVRNGILSRRVRFRDRADRESILESRRIVHMQSPHVAAIEWTLTPVDWSGKLEIHSGIDGRVTNSGVARYRDLNSNHLEILKSGISAEDTIFLLSQTNQSHIVMAQAVRTRVFIDGGTAPVERETIQEDEFVAHRLCLSCEEKKPVKVEKILSLYTSRDFAISEPGLEACRLINRLGDFEELLESHKRAWDFLWHRADLTLDTPDDEYPQLVLRLHIFHMLQTASMNTIDRDVGIPARGLHGEAYRGHIFWDELFTFPFLNLRIPELTRSLLMYRYRRLDEARHMAKKEGYLGAMYPWQSGSNGQEESQVMHLNPKSGRWIEDNTHRQRHVNTAIAYNIWQYHQATDDVEFLSAYGAEMLLDISRFLASLATYNTERKRYEIRGVVGPDEFHTDYPDSDEPGLNNNAYTNISAVWTIKTTLKAIDLLADDRREELLNNLKITTEDLEHWDRITRRMFVPFHGDNIISQFEGWDDLEEMDWEGLKERHDDIQRLDRVLEAEDDTPNRYKATKQADVLMLFFLYSAEELTEMLERLDYSMDDDYIPRNVEYYLDRTSHGSTLSRIVHAWVLARTDRAQSWHLFRDALASDIDDIQGGTTAEGIHLGAMAGCVDLIQRCYTGLEMREGVLWLNPLLPDELECLSLYLRYQGHWLRVKVTQDELEVALEKGRPEPARIGFQGKVYEMKQGKEKKFALSGGGARSAKKSKKKSNKE